MVITNPPQVSDLGAGWGVGDTYSQLDHWVSNTSVLKLTNRAGEKGPSPPALWAQGPGEEDSRTVRGTCCWPLLPRPVCLSVS